MDPDIIVLSSYVGFHLVVLLLALSPSLVTRLARKWRGA